MLPDRGPPGGSVFDSLASAGYAAATAGCAATEESIPNVLITGANRGLGLEFARQYAGSGWRVWAACRAPDKADRLEALAGRSRGRVTLHRLDVGDRVHIETLAGALGDEAVDVLLNNAGVSGNDGRGFGEVNDDSWVATLRVNTIAPMKIAEAFVEPVARSDRRVIACLSSRMGSIADNTSGGNYIYRSSKAALNAVVRSLAHDLRARGVIAVALHPGWVATDMGGPNAPLKPSESIAGLRAVIDRLDPADSGKFLNYDGTQIPW
ncbi:MAG: SDR family oxidoreductase [Alphaproteobacteria bacterium]